MSISIDFGDERPDQPTMQIATNRGWQDVVNWADGLKNEDYPDLLYFIDHCESLEIKGMISDIDKALKQDKPDDHTVVKTLRGLRAAFM